MKPTVLLVEDDELIIGLVAEILSSLGLEVQTCATGARVREILRASQPSLVLLDLSLPDIDGLVLLGWIRSTSDVPVIVCTARNSATEAFIAAQLGASDFIVKPFDLDNFESRIDAVLQSPATPGQTWAACETRPDDRVRVLCWPGGESG